MVKYCPKCGSELEIKHKCPDCRYIGPALYGKNNKELKEVEKMEEDIDNNERLLRAEEELKVAEELVSKIEPLKATFRVERDELEKLVKLAMYKINTIKNIDADIKRLSNGTDGELWNEIKSESFSPGDCVILDYAGKDWGVRLLQWFAGREK